MSDSSARIEKVNPSDSLRFIDEIRALKNRLLSIELVRLEESRQAYLERASPDSARRSGSGFAESSPFSRPEDRRYLEAEREISKAILLAKYDKCEATLTALSRHLRDLAPL